MPPFSPPPSFLHRCPGCCGDEYRHSQHRHGLRSQHGRWIFIIITARFMLPNVPGTAAISSEVSYTYHGGSIRDGARSLITFRGGGDIKKKNVKASVPPPTTPNTSSPSSPQSPHLQFWCVAAFEFKTHTHWRTRTHSPGCAHGESCFCVCVCVRVTASRCQASVL